MCVHGTGEVATNCLEVAMAEKNVSRPERECTVLDEEHGFPHVEPLDPQLVREQIEKDIADRRQGYEGRHRRDETAFAVVGVAA